MKNTVIEKRKEGIRSKGTFTGSLLAVTELLTGNETEIILGITHSLSGP